MCSSRNATTDGMRPAVLADRDHAEAPSPLRLASWSSVGSSLTHGAHQVAHRFTSTGLPLKSARLVSSPSGSLNVAVRRGLALVAAVDAFDRARLGGRLRLRWRGLLCGFLARGEREQRAAIRSRIRACAAAASARRGERLVGAHEAPRVILAHCRCSALAGCGRVADLKPARRPAASGQAADGANHADRRTNC